MQSQTAHEACLKLVKLNLIIFKFGFAHVVIENMKECLGEELLKTLNPFPFNTFRILATLVKES